MKLNFYLITSLLTVGLLFTAAPETANAQLTGVDTEEFRQIEQPIATKAAITLAGIGLMGLELWWFLLSSGQRKTPLKSSQEQAIANKNTATPSVVFPSVKLALSFNQEANRYYDELAIKIASVYDGIQMPRGVLAIEGRVSPQFSATPQFSAS